MILPKNRFRKPVQFAKNFAEGSAENADERSL